ncbi:MAG TPA: Pls/PosA family non-ribosomal peptide synthetase, partial [Acidimicrobiales bacterium]|nr:Pls/PosA family non-ribosomal peptide synthetase [Acidimicrobiales bacterium]
EDGAEIGHASSLHGGQTVPTGQRWHGSPARQGEEADEYNAIEPIVRGRLHRVLYSALLLLGLLILVGPAESAIAALDTHASLFSHASVGGALAVSAAVFLGFLVVGIVAAATIPRLLTRALEVGKVYPLYGFHHTLQRIATRTSNIRFFAALFGDSAAIVHYLRSMGYDLGHVEQTGSNFGMTVKQDMPTLSAVGGGTMISDGLSIMNAEFSSTSFRVLPTVIGRKNFLGNRIVYPAGGRTGENCLLATKVMIPISGAVRHDVGLLGSPPFEIPRSVQRDAQFRHLNMGSERRRRLAAKTRHNAVTMVMYLFSRYLFVAGFVLIALAARGGVGVGRWADTVGTIVLDALFPIAFFILVERVVMRFGRLQPRLCSIYDIAFWRHERYWKIPTIGYLQLLNGTPLKGVAWRLLGVDIGRQVFDDGSIIHERTLVSVGSHSSLNAGCTLSSHTLEEGTFKSDHIRIGPGCVVGTAAYVHYGVTMDAGSVLGPDSFLMKGSYVAPGARWTGNPATERSPMPTGRPVSVRAPGDNCHASDPPAH